MPVLNAAGEPTLVPTRVPMRIERTRPALGPDGAVLLGPAGEVLVERVTEAPVPGDFTILPWKWVRWNNVRAVGRARFGGDADKLNNAVTVEGEGVKFATGTAAERMSSPDILPSLIEGIVNAFTGGGVLGAVVGGLNAVSVQAWFNSLSDEEKQALIASFLAGQDANAGGGTE